MCQAAKDLRRTIGELLSEEVPKLPGDGSRRLFWKLMRDSVAKNLPATPATSGPAQPMPRKPAKGRHLVPCVSESHEQAMELIEEIRDRAESICENGQDFAASVLERAESIGRSVECGGGATEAQLAALENMLDGLDRWFHD